VGPLTADSEIGNRKSGRPTRYRVVVLTSSQRPSPPKNLDWQSQVAVWSVHFAEVG